MAKLPKVRVVRSQKREGLIRARLIGYREAKGEVLTYLDSHCECTKGEIFIHCKLLSLAYYSKRNCLFVFLMTQVTYSKWLDKKV